MEVDYFEYVVAVYDKRIEGNDISRRLVVATPASLRDLCLETCKKEFSRKDQLMLVDFFGPAADQAEMLAGIKRIDIDKFKSLIKYLRKETNKTNLLNIELLAWLLDIKDRPYNPKIEYKQKKEELSSHSHTSSCTEVEENERKDTIGEATTTHRVFESLGIFGSTASKGKEKERESLVKPGQLEQISIRRQLPKVAILPLIVLITGLIGFKLYDMVQKPQSCMYWTGERYEAVSCNVKMRDALIIAYDSVKVAGFKRIVNIDTITYNAIGHIWYSKMNNKVEFYTGEGRHPVQINYRLRPVTGHIIEVYAKGLN